MEHPFFAPIRNFARETVAGPNAFQDDVLEEFEKMRPEQIKQRIQWEASQLLG